jgi:hypothetical protein
LAGTYDGATMRVYLDGVLVTSTTVPGPITVTAGNLYFGTRREDRVGAPNETFRGALDEIRVYDRALAECEIRELANNPSPACTPADTTPPELTVPASITAEATSPAGAVVTYLASASDDVDGMLAPTCAPLSGSTFALASTQVVCAATDEAGNVGEATFDVLVEDTTPATLSLPAPISADATGSSGAAVSYSAAASDLVDGAVTTACAPASGSTFAVGPTTVHCSATDAHGNLADGTFTVTVRPPTRAVLLAELEALIRQYVDNGGIENSMLVKVRHGSFRALRHEIGAQTKKALTVAEAGTLLHLLDLIEQN